MQAGPYPTVSLHKWQTEVIIRASLAPLYIALAATVLAACMHSAVMPEPTAAAPAADHEQGIFHYDRAFSRLGQADYDGAVADMDKARTLIDPQSVDQYADGMHRVYFQSGVAYYDTGLYDDAIRLFDKAIDVAASPSDYPAAYYHRGMSHYRKGNHRRAIADFDLISHLQQNFPDAAHYSKLSQEELAK